MFREGNCVCVLFQGSGSCMRNVNIFFEVVIVITRLGHDRVFGVGNINAECRVL